MEVKQKTSEEELKEILDDGDIEFFFRVLYAEYREQIARVISRTAHFSLNVEDERNAFQQTMVSVWERLEAGGFDNDRPLRIVNQIAKRRTIDILRNRKFRRSIAENATNITDLVIDDLVGTQISLEWKLANEEEKQRFLQELPAIVGTLSEKQRSAFWAFYDCIEQVRPNDKYQSVVEHIHSSTGDMLTVSAVRSRLNQAFDNIRDEAMRRGFNFLEEKDL